MLKASASSIKFTSIYASLTKKELSHIQPYAYFLEIDNFKILLDCGWNELYEAKYINLLLPFVRVAELVLISSPEIRACGALPFVMEHISPSTMVVSTSVTSKMALHNSVQTFLYQHSQALHVNTNTDDFILNAEKLRASFNKLEEPYGNRVRVKHDDLEIMCECHFANRMFGVYSWIINYQIDKLLYCPDYSLNTSRILKSFSIPTDCNIALLSAITQRGSLDRNGLSEKNTSSKVYSDEFDSAFRLVQNTLRGGGDVLIPVCLACRGLEVVCTLARMVMSRCGDMYKVVMAAMNVHELLHSVTTMTEVLQDEIVIGDNALFANIIPCLTVEEVLQIVGPKIVFAEGERLDYGVAGELLVHFLPSAAEGAQNLILVTSSSPENSNAKLILELTDSQKSTVETFQELSLNKNCSTFPSTNSVSSTIEHGVVLNGKFDNRIHQDKSFIFTDSKSNLNTSHTKGNAFTFCIKRRTLLSDEELEEYYLNLEKELALREKLLISKSVFQLETAYPNQHHANRIGEVDAYRSRAGNINHERNKRKMYEIASNINDNSDNDNSDNDDDDEDEEDETIANIKDNAASTLTHNQQVPMELSLQAKEFSTTGLVLPEYAHYKSKHLLFPVLTNAERLLDLEEYAYGIPVSDEEQFIWQQRAPVRQVNDEGPSNASAYMANISLKEASRPYKVETVTYTLNCSSKVTFCDLSGYPDLVSLKAFLRLKLSFAKKLLLLRTNSSDGKAIAHFCRSQNEMHCGNANGIYQLTNLPRGIELAEPVYSYVVHLDSSIAQELPSTLKRVRSASFSNRIISYNDLVKNKRNNLNRNELYDNNREFGVFDSNEQNNSHHTFTSNGSAANYGKSIENNRLNTTNDQSWEVGWVNGLIHASYVNSSSPYEIFQSKEITSNIMESKQLTSAVSEIKDIENIKQKENKDEIKTSLKYEEFYSNTMSGNCEYADSISINNIEKNINGTVINKSNEHQMELDVNTEVKDVNQMTLTAISDEEIEHFAKVQKNFGFERGSFFVGSLDLNVLRNNSWRENNLISHFYRKAPLLVYDDGMCVRKANDGTVTFCGVANPDIFSLRRRVYEQYDQVLENTL